MSGEKIILASASPRRREILASLGLQFQIEVSEIDETLLPDELPHIYVERLAREKAHDIARRHQEGLVIGADTTVVLNDKILGKPADEAEARKMLALLAGEWHIVFTGVAVIDAASGEETTGVCETRVKIAHMPADEIAWYVATGEPMDKAGSYAIQGIGSLFVEEIEGNYLNVVGLPVTLLRKLVHKLGKQLL